MKNNNHEELKRIRDNSPVNSEEYLRAKDHIADINGETNNIQIEELANIIKDYKEETDRNIKNSHNLTVFVFALAIVQVVISFAQFALDSTQHKLIGFFVLVVITLLIFNFLRKVDKVTKDK